MKRKSLLLFVVFFIASANAQSFSSGPFYFDGGTVPPKNGNRPGMLRPMVPRGMHDSGMTISCDAENPNFKKPYPIVIKVNQVRQVLLNHEITRIVFEHRHINGEGDFYAPIIENLDDADAAYIKNCMSVYTTN